MTKEPADWAKIKAYRVEFPDGLSSEEHVLHNWSILPKACHELARMYDKYEKPPVDPDLLAAREWFGTVYVPGTDAGSGRYDRGSSIQGFLAGIKHGRANP